MKTTYTREEVLTILRAHLIKTTFGNLTTREFEIIGEVDSALPLQRISITDLPIYKEQPLFIGS